MTCVLDGYTPCKIFNTLPPVIKAGDPGVLFIVCIPGVSLQLSELVCSVDTYSHVLQFLYAEWQHFLSVAFFNLSLSSSPRLDPSLDRFILHIGTQTNLLACDIKDTSDILHKEVCFIHFLIFDHLPTQLHLYIHCTCLYMYNIMVFHTRFYIFPADEVTTTVQGPLACLTPP